MSILSRKPVPRRAALRGMFIGAAVSLAHAMVPEILAGHEVAAVPAPVACSPVEGDPLQTHVDVLAGLGIPVESYGDLLEASRTRYAELAENVRAAWQAEYVDAGGVTTAPGASQRGTSEERTGARKPTDVVVG